jgi:hypothetical protein
MELMLKNLFKGKEIIDPEEQLADGEEMAGHFLLPPTMNELQEMTNRSGKNYSLGTKGDIIRLTPSNF